MDRRKFLGVAAASAIIPCGRAVAKSTSLATPKGMKSENWLSRLPPILPVGVGPDGRARFDVTKSFFWPFASNRVRVPLTPENIAELLRAPDYIPASSPPAFPYVMWFAPTEPAHVSAINYLGEIAANGEWMSREFVDPAKFPEAVARCCPSATVDFKTNEWTRDSNVLRVEPRGPMCEVGPDYVHKFNVVVNVAFHFASREAVEAMAETLRTLASGGHGWPATWLEQKVGDESISGVCSAKSLDELRD